MTFPLGKLVSPLSGDGCELHRLRRGALHPTPRRSQRHPTPFFSSLLVTVVPKTSASEVQQNERRNDRRDERQKNLQSQARARSLFL